jgi:hypothetical protein
MGEGDQKEKEASNIPFGPPQMIKLLLSQFLIYPSFLIFS